VDFPAAGEQRAAMNQSGMALAPSETLHAIRKDLLVEPGEAMSGTHADGNREVHVRARKSRFYRCTSFQRVDLVKTFNFDSVLHGEILSVRFLPDCFHHTILDACSCFSDFWNGVLRSGSEKMKITHRGLASIALALSLSATLLTSVSPQGVAQKDDHSPAVLSPQELFKRISPSVFVVEVLDENGSLVATGSGVAMASDQVVTNKHVIDAGVAFRIKQGSRIWPAAVAYVDPDHDLGRLTAEGLKAPPVLVRLSSVLNVGERVYSIGAPEGLELTISEGLISGLREFEQARLIQTSAAISHGSSGGGLFDAKGQLVGITTFFLKEGQNLNFALPGEGVRAVASHRVSLAEKNKIGTPTSHVLSWFQLGVQMVDAAEYEKAVRAFREVVRLAPGESAGWYNLGVVYNNFRAPDIPPLESCTKSPEW